VGADVIQSQTLVSKLRVRQHLDETPSAVVHAGNSPANTGNAQERVIYLHTDHLETPRKASDANARIVWSWEADAFGAAAPNEDVDGDGKAVTVSLPVPGAVLRCGVRAALQLASVLRCAERAVCAKRSDWARRRHQYLCVWQRKSAVADRPIRTDQPRRGHCGCTGSGSRSYQAMWERRRLPLPSDLCVLQSYMRYRMSRRVVRVAVGTGTRGKAVLRP
jgi:hypothetical protein